jgi:hypothetical protein
VIGPTPWRIRYKPTDRSRERAALYPCALAARDDRCTTLHSHSAALNLMVWDHCHLHGFIRGPLCAYHNGRMRRYDSGHERFIYDPHLIEHARRCAECSGPW